MVLRLGLVNVLNNQITFVPGFIDIAFGDFRVRHQIIFSDSFEHLEIICKVFVQHRCTRLKRRFRRQHGRQLFIFDIDQKCCSAGCFFILGRDTGDRLTHITDFAFGDGTLVFDEWSHFMVFKIITREYAFDAGNFFSRRGVVSNYPRMGIGTL